MIACSRCGVSAWHPEARMCLLTDCELRAPQVLPAAVAPKTISRHLAGGQSACATGGFVDHPDHERLSA